MATILVKHTVEDFAKWKQAFDANSDVRKTFGSQGGKLFRSVTNPNEVTIVLHWSDLNKAKQFAESAELKTAMQNAGVTGQPQIQFLENETPFTV